jgi:hypothetical protein
MNGTVRGMGFHGVRMQGDGSVVERVQTHSNGGPGIVVGEAVIDSVAEMNGGTTGIIALTVRGSTVRENRGVGIFIRTGGSAIGNLASFNGGDGISATKAAVTGNTVTNNGGFGITISCPGVVLGNASIDNAQGNFRITGVCALANNSQ